MRAAIDIGSNSVRLAKSDGIRRANITKLADGIERTGTLSPAGVAATLDVLAAYAAETKGCAVTAFATEAVRRAKDGALFVAAVKARTGLTVKVVPPETEAQLALFGASKPDGAATVCDLGGGSMEVVSAADGVTPDYVKSLPLGVVVLKNKFAPFGADKYRAAIDAAPTLVAEYGKVADRPLVMLGGSACNIAAGFLGLRYYDADKVNGCRMTAADLDGFLPILMSDKLSVLRPVCEKRADTIAFGAIIIQALMNHIGADSFTVSDCDNLDAVLNGFEL